MIGWKIVCDFDEKEVVCEVVGQAISDENYFAIPVYYNNCIRMAWFSPGKEVKVIERK
ncbi:hypothetical protein AB6E04_22150 [Vibrio amylolyticus]|uniref:hypothetical protein n=1 Tax=Vibrio amylolyticus TaxID=2847292 RepID=UPI00354F889A